MGWLERFSPSAAAAEAAAGGATIINGAPPDVGERRGSAAAPVTPNGPDPCLSEEIKRRQVALLLRYVMAIRLR